MGRYPDLTGQTFGRLTVLEKSDQKAKGGYLFWRCRCECGSEKLATTSRLKGGRAKSCGCLRRGPRSGVDLTGQIFGRLTVLKKSDQQTTGGHYLWRCRCACGSETLTTTFSLKKGSSKSCGCLRCGPRSGTDLTGQIFDRLTVLEKTTQQNEYGNYLWRCRCVCGGEKMTTAFILKKGLVKSCGCLRREPRRAVDLTGQTFDRLTVLEKTTQQNEYGCYLWRCRCVCGGEKLVTSGNLNSGNTKSCGCLQRELRPVVDLTGQTFGRLTVLKRSDHKEYGAYLWLCRCVCGGEKRASTSNLKLGFVRSCGCLRRGPHHL